MAIASLVVGIVSIFTFGGLIVGAIVGLVLGIVSVRRASQRPTEYGGKGLGIAGIVVSSIGLAYSLVYTVFVVGIIGLAAWTTARVPSNERAAIETLNEICRAEDTYKLTSGNGDYGSALDLMRAKLVTGSLEMRQGYRFKIQTDPGTSIRNYREPGFRVYAIPMTYGISGTRSFFVSQDGKVRGADNLGREASASDPVIDNGVPGADSGGDH